MTISRHLTVTAKKKLCLFQTGRKFKKIHIHYTALRLRTMYIDFKFDDNRCKRVAVIFRFTDRQSASQSHT